MQKTTARPLAIGLIVLGALVRVTQALNFAPVGALSLFAGARLRGWQAYLLPLATDGGDGSVPGRLFVRHAVCVCQLPDHVWIGTPSAPYGESRCGSARRRWPAACSSS